jgi:hypothetical protein
MIPSSLNLLPLTGLDSSGRVHERDTEVAATEDTLSLGGDGGSLSKVFPVTSDEEGPAPLVLKAWTENVYIVDFLRLETMASNLE